MGPGVRRLNRPYVKGCDIWLVALGQCLKVPEAI